MHNVLSRAALCGAFLTGMLGLSAQPAPSQPVPETLDLATALQYALDNNYAIRQARERIKQQEGVVLEVSSRRIPNVSVGAAYQRNDRDIATTFPQDDSAWNIQIQARQAIYAGGGIDASVASSKLVREAAILELRGVINDALLTVRTRFYDVLLARESIKVREQSVALLQEQLQNAKNRFEAGASSSFEVLRAEVALANAQPALIQARNAFRLAIEELRQALGFANTEGDNLKKVPEFVGELKAEPTSFDLKSSLEAARGNRPELARLSKLEEAREQGVRVARSSYLPSVDAVAGYQWRKTGLSDRFRDAADGWLVGVQSQWNVFDGRATAGRVAQARSLLAQAQLTRGETELSIEVEVRRALSSLQEAWELAEASRKVVDQAAEALRLANVRQSAGTATQLDVLTSQVDLTQARNNQLQANYNYLVALAFMRKAMGQSDTFVTAP
ncbi:MAG TPA: TolC family protein [Opitutaceae bacterium]|nr:TolC family protein [Opitutaceae bacterium]